MAEPKPICGEPGPHGVTCTRLAEHEHRLHRGWSEDEERFCPVVWEASLTGDASPEPDVGPPKSWPGPTPDTRCIYGKDFREPTGPGRCLDGWEWKSIDGTRWVTSWPMSNDSIYVIRRVATPIWVSEDSLHNIRTAKERGHDYYWLQVRIDGPDDYYKVRLVEDYE